MTGSTHPRKPRARLIAFYLPQVPSDPREPHGADQASLNGRMLRKPGPYFRGTTSHEFRRIWVLRCEGSRDPSCRPNGCVRLVSNHSAIGITCSVASDYSRGHSMNAEKRRPEFSILLGVGTSAGRDLICGC